MENLENITYKLVLNMMMREISINYIIRKEIEKITLSNIPMETKKRGAYLWFKEAYESECNYNKEKKRLEGEMCKSVSIMN